MQTGRHGSDSFRTLRDGDSVCGGVYRGTIQGSQQEPRFAVPTCWLCTDLHLFARPHDSDISSLGYLTRIDTCLRRRYYCINSGSFLQLESSLQKPASMITLQSRKTLAASKGSRSSKPISAAMIIAIVVVAIVVIGLVTRLLAMVTRERREDIDIEPEGAYWLLILFQ